MKEKVLARPDPDSQYYTIPQSAAVLNISVRGMYRILKSRNPPKVCRLSPRKVVIRKDDLDAWVNARKSKLRPSNPNGATPAPPAG